MHINVFFFVGSFIATLSPDDSITAWLNPDGGAFMMTCHPNKVPKNV